MEGILNLLRKLGYSENEIKTVLNKVPTSQEGLMGTNVATGIFSKPKEGKLAKDFLVSDVIGNPFEIDYYKGRSKEDILTSASAQLKMIDDELANLTDQILNKNLQLTQEQKINFAKNLEAKRRFEKDFEAFKTKPEAEVLDIETGKKVGDIETLKEKSGLVAPPTSPIGRIDLMNKQMLQRADELFPSEATLQKEEAKRQALIAKQYEGKGYAGGTFGPSGMYRSVARDFLLDQNAKGKIKLTDDVIKNLEERNYISGGQPLMYPDPIRVMRFHYGDDVFDKIPLDKIPTGARSEIIDAMSKVEANPVKIESPVTPGGYMTPGEMKANIDELKNIERMIKRRESRFADMTEEQIQNELEQYGSKRSSFEMAFQSDHPEAYETYLKKQEKGGDIKAALKNYSYREKPNQFYEFGKEPKMDVYHIADDMAEYVYQKPFDELPQDLKSKLLDAANEEYINVLSIGDEGFAKGGSVGSKGLDYLTGMEPPKNGYAGGGRVNFEKGSIPKMLKFLIDKLADEKNFNKTLLEKSNPKAIQELYIEQYGKLPSAEEIKDIVNKQLQNKGSMETVNPKTGEVTTPKEPVTIADKKRQLTKEEIEDYEEAIGRNSEEWMSEGTVDEAEKALKRSKAEEAYYLQQYKTGQLDPKPGEKSQSRMRFLQKKAEEAELTGDRRLFNLDELDELDELERTFNKKNTSAGGFDFNDPDIKAQMEKAMQEGNKRSKEMRAMGLDPAKSKDYDEYIKIKEASGDKNFNKYFDDLEIKTKFKGVISDDLLNQILIDDNPQRKAEVIATIEQGLTMQEKGMSPEQIVDILKNTTRTKQAKGGSIGLNYLMGL
jgi:hypothetical protein